MRLLLFHDLFVEPFLGGDFLFVTIPDFGEVFAELDVSEFRREVLVGGEVGEALQVLAGVHGDGVPINEFELVHEVEHLWHDLQLEGPRLLAPIAHWHVFLRQPVLLRGPHRLQYAVLAQRLQRRHVPDDLLGILLTDIVEELVCLAHITVLLGLVEHLLQGLDLVLDRYFLYVSHLLRFLVLLFLLLLLVVGQQFLGVLGIELVGLVEVLDTEHLVDELAIVVEVTVRLLSDLHLRSSSCLNDLLSSIQLLQYLIRLLAVKSSNTGNFKVTLNQKLLRKDVLLLLNCLLNPQHLGINNHWPLVDPIFIIVVFVVLAVTILRIVPGQCFFVLGLLALARAVNLLALDLGCVLFCLALLLFLDRYCIAHGSQLIVCFVYRLVELRVILQELDAELVLVGHQAGEALHG